MGNIVEEFEAPPELDMITFDQEAAVQFISKDTGIDEESVRKVLTSELGYLVEIGLVELAPESALEEA